jgi:Fe-S-cluster-containing dehydrogenase component/CRP-like cAMP-binding protein
MAELVEAGEEERNRRWDEPFGDEPLDAETVAGILSLPVFAGVDPAEFPASLSLDQIIANDGRLRSFQRNEVIIRKGDYGNSLFVILAGSVVGVTVSMETETLGRGPNPHASWWKSIAQLFVRANVPEYRPARRRWGRRRTPAPPVRDPEDLLKLDIERMKERYPTFALKGPEVFGELAALTRSPRIATVVASENHTLLFELRWQGLRDIRTWSSAFRQRVDRIYRARGMVSRLGQCPILRHLSQQALDEIAKESLFETYGNVDWMHRFKREIEKRADGSRVIEQETVICEQGDHVDGLLLINRGFARVTERVDHGERAVAHLSENDVFGLGEIAEIAAGHHGTSLRTGLRAIGYVDIIRIPTKLVSKHVLPGLPERFLADRRTVEEASPEQSKLRQEMMDFIVDHRFINGEKAMVINLDRCVGCDDCVRACATAHDNNPRFTRHGFSYHNAMVAHACMHCTDPVCLIGCPTGAIHREEDTGTVVINDGTCIGCATCANSCPYDNIKMVDIRDRTGAFLLDADGQRISRATKCDLCVDQLTGPACVQACPHDALIRIDIRDSGKLLTWLG